MNSLIKAVRSGLVLVAVCLGLGGSLALPAKAGDTRFFVAPSQAFGATNNYCIVPAVGDRVAVVRSLECTTDLTAARVTVFSNGPLARVVYDVGSSNIQVEAGATGGTNGLAAGDNILIHAGNNPTDWYARVRVVTVGTTNILYTPTLSATIPSGSYFYRVSTNHFFYGMTNGLTSPRNSFVAVSQRGQPMLIDLNTGSAGSLNAIGEYIAEK